jgi:hypothetical protein
MARDLTAGMLAEITADELRPVLFYTGVFNDGTVRLWTGDRTINYDGYTWTAAGQLLNISPITETSDSRAVGITVSLSGMPESLISLALSQARQGLACSIGLGAIDAAGNIVVDAYESFQGRLDVPEIVDTGDTCTISISYESRMIDIERARERRYTDEDQKLDYPSDRGFEYVPAIQDTAVVWG